MPISRARRLDAAAADIKRAFKRLFVAAERVGEQDLFDLGPRGVGLHADDGGVDRRLAPAIDVEAEAHDFGLDDRAGAFLRAEVGARQEDLADADLYVRAR